MIEFLKSEHMYHRLLRNVANSLLQQDEIALEAREYIFLVSVLYVSRFVFVSSVISGFCMHVQFKCKNKHTLYH